MDWINKNTNSVIIAVVVLVAVIVLFGDRGGEEKILLQNDYDNTISVTGEAERFVKPDTASVSFTMTRKSRVLSEATDSVNERIVSTLSKSRMVTAIFCVTRYPSKRWSPLL